MVEKEVGQEEGEESEEFLKKILAKIHFFDEIKNLITRAYSLVHPRAQFQKDDGPLNGKKRMGHLKENHHLNRGGAGGKGKIAAKACVRNKCLP
jgi:hypothetical protein